MTKVSEAIALRWPKAELTINCPENCVGRFYTSPCDSCGSTLAGERHPAVGHATGFPAGTRMRFGILICVDCLAWLANGQDFDFETREPVTA